jgi:hypothetical protein
LHHFLGVLWGPQDAIAVDLELAPMTVDETVECVLVAGLRTGDEIAVHRSSLRTSVSPEPG